MDTQKRRGWEAKACESCHGPGGKHAGSADKADIVNPAKLAPAAADRDCLKCHLNQPTHIGRIQSSHAKNEVSCTACHSIHRHGPNGLVPRKAAAINEQCAGCHTAVWAAFQRPYKHRLPEGAMSCVDCHNPHGSIQPPRANLTRPTSRAASAATAICAARSLSSTPPSAWKAAPLATSRTARPTRACLVRAEVRYLCLECHANLPAAPGPVKNPPALGGVPPAFHDLFSPQFQNCTVCHIKIHGSYVNQELLR